jgi:hypothetical protein
LNFDLTPDQIALQEKVREFAQAEIAPRAEQLDRDGVFPTDLFHKLGDLGVMSIPFPEELGGMGLGVFEATLAIEEIARADQSLAVSAMVSIATGLTVARFGTEQQKRDWLPDIVSGRKMCSIAGTEPDAGSDTAGFKTRATEVEPGIWSLSGEKAYITNPGTEISSFAIILAVSSPREEQSKEVHAVSGAERCPWLHARRKIPQDGVALVRYTAALSRQLPASGQRHRRQAARWTLGSAQGLPGGTAISVGLLARPCASKPRSLDQIRQGAQGIRQQSRPSATDPGDDRQDGAQGR